MTNSEAIEQLKFLNKVDFHIDTKEACDIAIDLFQENTKLKAEIEQLKEEVLANENWSDVVERTLKKEIDKNEMLKSKLEQSVKLPCKVGDIVYECDKDVKEIKCYKIKRMQSVTIELDFIGDIFTRSKLVSCGSEYIGNLIFLTREEAEQALKGKVEK